MAKIIYSLDRGNNLTGDGSDLNPFKTPFPDENGNLPAYQTPVVSGDEFELEYSNNPYEYTGTTSNTLGISVPIKIKGLKSPSGLRSKIVMKSGNAISAFSSTSIFLYMESIVFEGISTAAANSTNAPRIAQNLICEDCDISYNRTTGGSAFITGGFLNAFLSNSKLYSKITQGGLTGGGTYGGRNSSLIFRTQQQQFGSTNNIVLSNMQDCVVSVPVLSGAVLSINGAGTLKNNLFFNWLAGTSNLTWLQQNSTAQSLVYDNIFLRYQATTGNTTNYTSTTGFPIINGNNIYINLSIYNQSSQLFGEDLVENKTLGDIASIFKSLTSYNDNYLVLDETTDWFKQNLQGKAYNNEIGNIGPVQNTINMDDLVNLPAPSNVYIGNGNYGKNLDKVPTLDPVFPISDRVTGTESYGLTGIEFDPNYQEPNPDKVSEDENYGAGGQQSGNLPLDKQAPSIGGSYLGEESNSELDEENVVEDVEYLNLGDNKIGTKHIPAASESADSMKYKIVKGQSVILEGQTVDGLYDLDISNSPETGDHKWDILKQLEDILYTVRPSTDSKYQSIIKKVDLELGTSPDNIELDDMPFVKLTDENETYDHDFYGFGGKFPRVNWSLTLRTTASSTYTNEDVYRLMEDLIEAVMSYNFTLNGKAVAVRTQSNKLLSRQADSEQENRGFEVVFLVTYVKIID